MSIKFRFEWLIEDNLYDKGIGQKKQFGFDNLDVCVKERKASRDDWNSTFETSRQLTEKYLHLHTQMKFLKLRLNENMNMNI